MFRNTLYKILIFTFVAYFTGFVSVAFADDFSDSEVWFNEDTAVYQEELSEMRGTALSPEILGVAVIESVLSNNVAKGTVSGGNSINGSAFSSSSGVSTVIQNSGNNVSINTATILTINIE